MWRLLQRRGISWGGNFDRCWSCRMMWAWWHGQATCACWYPSSPYFLRMSYYQNVWYILLYRKVTCDILKWGTLKSVDYSSLSLLPYWRRTKFSDTPKHMPKLDSFCFTSYYCRASHTGDALQRVKVEVAQCWLDGAVCLLCSKPDRAPNILHQEKSNSMLPGFRPLPATAYHRFQTFSRQEAPNNAILKRKVERTPKSVVAAS